MKYDWIALEKEFITSDYKSVSAFLKDKGIKRNGSTQKAVKGWNEKRVQKELKKSSKTIEKVIEIESTKEAENIVNLKNISDKLARKIEQAITELDQDVIQIKTRTKKNIPNGETIREVYGKTVIKTITDRKGLRDLAAALKDLNDINNNTSTPEEGQRVTIINTLPNDEE